MLEMGRVYGTLKNNKFFAAVCSYMKDEFLQRGGINVDVRNEWKLSLGDCTPTQAKEFTGLYVCKYLHMILKGMRNPFFSGSELEKFKKVVIDSLKKRLGS
jgi:hypothetical protein